MGLFPWHKKTERIDLGAYGGRIDLVALSTMGQEWGRPGHCPRCGHQGLLDRIDLVDLQLHQHCTSCRHRWITAQRDLRPVESDA